MYGARAAVRDNMLTCMVHGLQYGIACSHVWCAGCSTAATFPLPNPSTQPPKLTLLRLLLRPVLDPPSPVLPSSYRPPGSPATVTGTGPLPLPISIRPCRPPSLHATVTGTGTLWRTAGHRVQCSSACLSSARWITSWTRRGEEARSSPSCTGTVVQKFGVWGEKSERGPGSRQPAAG